MTDDDLRVLLTGLGRRFETLSRELANASADIARFTSAQPGGEPAVVHDLEPVAEPLREPVAARTPVSAPAAPELELAVTACARCGRSLPPTARFCTRCGHAVAEPTVGPPPQPPPLVTELGPRAAIPAEPEPEPEDAPAAAPATPRWALSEAFALRALGWVAGVVTLLGIVFLYSLAEQRGWVGPEVRVGLGVTVSAGLLALALVLRRRYGEELEALAAAGTAIAGLYVSLFAAVELYDIIPAAVGLPLALLISVLAVGIALSWESEPLAVLGLAGAMVAPPASEHAVTPLAMGFVVVLTMAGAVLWVRRDWPWLMGTASAISLVEAVAMVVDAASQPRGGFVTPWGAVVAATAYWAAYQAAIVARRRWPAGHAWDDLAAGVSIGAVAFAYSAAAALFRGDDRGLAFLAVAGAYLAMTALLWRLRLGTRDLLTVFWTAGVTAGVIAVVLLLHGDALVAVLALNGALHVELARRLGEPRLQISSALHVALATAYALAEAPPANLLTFPADGFTRHGHVSGDLVLSADLSVVSVALALTVFAARSGPYYIWRDPRVRLATFWTAIVGVLYAVSMVIVSGFLWYDYTERSFQNGHTLVSAAWAAIALILVAFGFRRHAVTLRYGGIVLLVATLAKLFLFDLAQLEAMARAVSFMAVGVISLIGAVIYRRMAERAAREDGGQAGRGVPSTGSDGSNV